MNFYLEIQTVRPIFVNIKKDGIEFSYINENPEVAGKTEWGDFDTKMYANVLLDDKAGFDPEEDWHALLHHFSTPL